MPAAQKAKAAARAVKKGVEKRTRKERSTTKFFRPKTQTKQRAPKYARSTAAAQTKLDRFRVIKAPVTTESAVKMVEEINTLVFKVDSLATKPQIRSAIEQTYDIKVARVNTMNTPKGYKKAFVKLTADYDALDVANRVGII